MTPAAPELDSWRFHGLDAQGRFLTTAQEDVAHDLQLRSEIEPAEQDHDHGYGLD